MKLKKFWIEIMLKVKQFSIMLILAVIFWISGIIYYATTEPDKSISNILLISFTFRSPMINSDFSGFYSLFYSLFAEFILFGFLISVLLERYNPVATSKIIAEHMHNHSVILGYNHLGERIVDYILKKGRNYSLIEIEENKVTELMNASQPVVVGDYTEEINLEAAGVPSCKEVFLVTNDLRRAIVGATKVRKMNKSCHIYMRVFDESFQDFLRRDPWRAYTYSTSHWTMESVKKWTAGETASAIVLGDDHIALLISDYLVNVQNRKVYLVDPDLDPDKKEDNLMICQDNITGIDKLEEICNLQEIGQIFICWRSEDTFSRSIFMVMALRKKYPNMKVYIRIYDEELAPILKDFKSTTFSTSSYAFHMLQKEVQSNSAIYSAKLAKNLP